MVDSNRERSRIANNRLAAAVVATSLLVAAVVVSLYRVGLFDAFAPERGPAPDAIPLYLLLVVFFVALVVWSWGRFLSWFE